MYRAEQNAPFEKPVRFMRSGSLIGRVNSVNEAAYFMLHSWPNSGGEKYNVAREACRRALAKQCSAEDARQAFIVALSEGGMQLVG